jgi:hypothetical protein
VDDVETFTYRLENPVDGQASTADLTILIQDDAPVAGDAVGYVTPTASLVTTNLVVIFDRSGSMDDDPGVPGYATRIALAQDAVGNLIDGYDLLGNLNVKVVDFAGTAAETPDDAWLDAADAKSYIAGLSANGGTHYQNAISDTINGFEQPEGATQTLVYFITDGNENSGSNVAALQGPWESFVDANVDEVFAIGVGGGVNLSGGIEVVAYPGEPTLISDADLEATLLGTVDSEISGTIKVTGEGGTDIAFGADGGYIQSIEVNGVARQYSPGDAAIQSFTTALGAELVINFQTGAYTYVIPDTATIPTGSQEVFALTVVDLDGDVINGGSLTINVQETVVASGEDIITNLASTADIADSVLLQNDIDLNFDSLSVTARSDGANTIDYTVSNGVESHDVSANVTLLGGNDLQGTGADEVLLAGGGDDILVGGAGDDILIGGGGGDGLSGGSGSDTFVWQSTDGGAAGSPVTDVVSDFGRSEGDVLNLADLLVDESAGNLADYLHFEQSDPDTVVLHVSSNGGFSGGYQASVEDQTIILENFSLDGLGTTDTEIIDALIAGNNLITD